MLEPSKIGDANIMFQQYKLDVVGYISLQLVTTDSSRCGQIFVPCLFFVRFHSCVKTIPVGGVWLLFSLPIYQILPWICILPNLKTFLSHRSFMCERMWWTIILFPYTSFTTAAPNLKTVAPNPKTIVLNLNHSAKS